MSLLKSKSYGLATDMLWSLRPHKIIRELEYKPPRAEIHTFKYQHEKECADVFVSIALTGRLLEWVEHQKLDKGIIPDRIFRISETPIYLENERGTQGLKKVENKFKKYQKYWVDTKEDFHVLVLVSDEKALLKMVTIFDNLNVPYWCCVLDDFVASPLTAQITSRYDSFTLEDKIL